MAPPTRTEDLSTSVHLFLPLFLFSLVSVVLFVQSKWFGGLFVLLLVAEYAIIRRIGTARKVNFKILERSLLSIIILLLAILSLLSFAYYPTAKYALCISLMSLMVPHLLLLWRIRSQVNHNLELIRSTLLLIGCITTAGYCINHGFEAVILNVSVFIYALAVLCEVVMMMREKVPFNLLRWISLAVSIVLVALCLILKMVAVVPFPSVISTSVCAVVLYSYVDFMFYQMQVPLAEWSEPESMDLSISYVAVKFSSVLIVGAYGIAGHIAGSGRISNEDEVMIFLIFLFLIIFHLIFSIAVWALYDKEPYDSQLARPLDGRFACGITAIVVIVTLMVFIGYSYFTVTLPIVVPESILLIFVGLLYLLLVYSIDRCRIVFAPYFGVLSGTAFFLFFCLLLNAATTLKTTHYVSADEPKKRVVIIAGALLIALCIHFFAACICESKKKGKHLSEVEAARKAAAAAAAATPSVEGAAAPAAAEAIPLQDKDSDYDSERE